MKDLVSIVIPCYNDEDYIGESIRSALKQDFKKEVIVVDDWSTDESLDIIRSFGEEIKYISQENKGAPSARNKGLSVAKGNLVKFHDSDDVLLEGVVSRQVNALNQIDDERSVIFSDLYCSAEIRNSPDKGFDLKEVGLKYLVGDAITTPCTIHRKSLLTEVGGFKEGLSCGQEYDLHIRMKIKGVRFFYQPGGTIEKKTERERGISKRTHPNKNPYPKIDLYRHIESVIESGYEGIPSSAKKPLARRWWITGRQALRGGNEHGAKICFKKALQLSQDCVCGSVPYRFLVEIAGPYYAEHTGTWLKKYGLH